LLCSFGTGNAFSSSQSDPLTPQGALMYELAEGR
jgi:hypothetical protein